MDTHKLQVREGERRDHHNHNHNHSTKHERLPPPPPPPSSTTSPSHDFSFTISLVPSPPPPPPSPPLSAAAAAAASLDLAPADDIFLHGHLLPLQYSLPSTHATIPTPTATTTTTTTTSQNNSGSNNVDSIEKPSKPKSLSSLFGLGKPKKASEEEAEKGKKDRRSSHKVFDVARLLRKCMVEPIRVLMAGGDRERRRDLRRGQRPHSFSGHLNPREKDVYSWRRRRRPGGQASAPASMRTSPTNSGHLSATSLNMSSSDESTMEELQSAIQAAIAHCKNSIAAAKKG